MHQGGTSLQYSPLVNWPRKGVGRGAVGEDAFKVKPSLIGLQMLEVGRAVHICSTAKFSLERDSWSIE